MARLHLVILNWRYNEGDNSQLWQYEMERIIKCRSDIWWYTNELTTDNNGQPEAFCCMVNYTADWHIQSYAQFPQNLEIYVFSQNWPVLFPKINWRKTTYFDFLGFAYELCKTLSVIMPIEPVLDRASRAQDAFWPATSSNFRARKWLSPIIGRLMPCLHETHLPAEVNEHIFYCEIRFTSVTQTCFVYHGI